MSPPTVPPEQDPLQPLLDDAEQELRRRLHEACEAEAKGVSTESTAEIRRLEDTLLAAAVAAEQTITLRRHMKQRGPVERERPIRLDDSADRKRKAGSAVPESGGSEMGTSGYTPGARVREFKDPEGHAWRAWPVVPGLSRASASGRGFLGNFQDGWICFEGLDTTGRRRLPCRQQRWMDVTDEELRELLAQAIDAPGRKTRSGNG